MSEQCQEKRGCSPAGSHQKMCIHTRKITDSCRDKDCIEDLRVYLTGSSQNILDSAASARVRCAELIYTDIRTEPVAFDRNHYCIDVTFYYRITADAVISGRHPAALTGLAVFQKRAVLCGEDSHAHIYSSANPLPEGSSALLPNDPTAIVEVLDPMVLSSRLMEVCRCHDSRPCPVPLCIRSQFDEELCWNGDKQRLYVTLGQFSIIRLERDAQVAVPVLDYCIPTRECSDCPGCGEDPCEMFSKIPFPEKQFNPEGCSDGCSCKDVSH